MQIGFIGVGLTQMATLDTVVHENASVSLCPYICGG